MPVGVRAGDDGARGVLVAVGFAEALAAPEVVWSLVDSGFKVVAFARKGRRAAVRHSRHVRVHEITAPETDWGAALGELTELLGRVRRDAVSQCVVLPLDDSSLWLCDRMPASSEWISAGTHGRRTELAIDKRAQMVAAAEAGLCVPSTQVASTTEDVTRRVSGFPVILREANAVSSDGRGLRKGRNWICSDEAELAMACRARRGDRPVLIQPFLEGAGEGVFGLATDSGVRAWSAHRRLRMMNPHGSGSSACVSQAVPDEIRDPIERLVKMCDWRGMFMCEFLRTTDGRLWFIEFNGRAWGSMALARRQSLEYPAWTVRQALGWPLILHDSTVRTEDVICRHLGRELMHVLFVLRGAQSRAIRQWPSLGGTFKKVFRLSPRHALYNWRREEWPVFVADCWYTIREQLFKAS